MILLLIGFLIVALVFTVFGNGFVFYFDRNNSGNYRFADTFFIGLCIVGTILNAWSLFFPTNDSALFFLVIVAALLLAVQRKAFLSRAKDYLPKNTNTWIFCVLVVAAIAIVLLYGVVTPKLYDSYLYHINAIQWNSLYRAVPGLANFHDRFGFNSSVFVLSAGFSFIQFFGQYIFVISSLSFLVFFIWLLQEIYFRKNLAGLFCLVFLYYFTFQYTWDISSPGSDLLSNMIVAFVLISLLFDSESVKKKSLVLIILPLFCLTLKLSVMPIMLVTVFTVYHNKKNVVGSVKTLIAYGLLLLLPWIARNVILTGYVIFPFDRLDIFDFDWEVSKDSIIETKEWVYSWARIPLRDYREVLAMSFTEWFAIWWKAATMVNKTLFVFAALSPVTVGIYCFWKRKENLFPILVVFAAAYSSFLLWLFSAPDFRFSFAFILVLALLPLLFLTGLARKTQKIFNPLLIVCLLYVMYGLGLNGYNLFSEEYQIRRTSEYAYKPINVSYVKSRRNIQFETLTLQTKGGKQVDFYGPKVRRTQCFDKFPCTWYVDYRFQMRGEDLQEGFQRNPF